MRAAGWISGILFATITMAPGGEPEAGIAENLKLPCFVGRSQCTACHARGSTASICSLEPISAHGEAYYALSAPAARHIAALSGIQGPPQQSRICLGCHATAADEGARWTTGTFDIRDGVQCEACHGPGSLHAEKHRTQAGARPLGDRDVRRGDRNGCITCHVDRPSHGQVLEGGFRLSEWDGLYKTPVNLVASADGDRLFAVCEESDSVIAVRVDSGERLWEARVGHRPHDAALSPDAMTLYVTNRVSGTVSILDARTGAVRNEIPVGAEPHGLWVNPGDSSLCVLLTGQDAIVVLQPDREKAAARLTGGAGPWSVAANRNNEKILVTNVRPSRVPFRASPGSEITVVDVLRRRVHARICVEEANMLQGIAYVPGRDVALFTFLRTKNLVPLTRLGQGWTITNGVGIVWPDGRVDQVLLDAPFEAFPDPMDISVSPNGRVAAVTSGGSDQIALIDVERLLATVSGAEERERRETIPNHLGYQDRFVFNRVSVGRNPRGLTFSPDGSLLFVTNALDDTITVLDGESFEVLRTISLGGPTVASPIRRGAKVFHDARVAFGNQFSCRSCHPDGHTNGLTFDIEAEGIGLRLVDNRSLRGIVDTAPFKWEGTNPSLRRQCGPRLAVFFTRLAPYAPEDLDALILYESTIELPPNPYRDPRGLSDSQRRGKLVFERTRNNRGEEIPPERRCNTCHCGPFGTNRQQVTLQNTLWFDAAVSDAHRFDLADVGEFGELGSYYMLESAMPANTLDVPHLTNIFEGAPYLHNGAAPTLEEIWSRFNLANDHGATDDLTRGQYNDLIEYLKSL